MFIPVMRLSGEQSVSPSCLAHATAPSATRTLQQERERERERETNIRSCCFSLCVCVCVEQLTLVIPSPEGDSPLSSSLAVSMPQILGLQHLRERDR